MPPLSLLLFCFLQAGASASVNEEVPAPRHSALHTAAHQFLAEAQAMTTTQGAGGAIVAAAMARLQRCAGVVRDLVRHGADVAQGQAGQPGLRPLVVVAAYLFSGGGRRSGAAAAAQHRVKQRALVLLLEAVLTGTRHRIRTQRQQLASSAAAAADGAAESFAVGDFVKLRGLSKAVELNGQLGCVVGIVQEQEPPRASSDRSARPSPSPAVEPAKCTVRLVGSAACRVVKAAHLSSRALTPCEWLDVGEPRQALWVRAAGAQTTFPPHHKCSLGLVLHTCCGHPAAETEAGLDRLDDVTDVMLHCLVRSYDRDGADRRAFADDLHAKQGGALYSSVGGKSLGPESRSWHLVPGFYDCD